MKKSWVAICLSVLSIPLLAGIASGAEVWVVDILSNPSRFWNTEVTVTGMVQTITPNPVGTTRGYFTLLDDSTPNALVVRTKNLPGAGKTYTITGMIVQDARYANVPVLSETKRTTPGMSKLMTFVLAAGGVILLALIVVLIVLLTRTKKGPQTTPVGKTTKIPSGPAADKTQMYTHLGADIVVEKGPDKGKEFPLHKPVMTIGRPGSRKNDIELRDDTVSKEQASIHYDSAKKVFSITNESSTNPTKVNDRIISGPTSLEDGALVEIGRTVLRFKKSS